MRIQKYKAKAIHSDKELIGYITETRKYIGNGSYSDETTYLMTVTEKSMPKGDYGTWIVQKESIEAVLYESD